MPRKQTIIIYPHLNDCGGDLTKQWYVEYKWRIPGETKQRKERIYKGLSSGSREDRIKIANKIIKNKKAWLQSGNYLQGNEKKVYEDELLYRSEARLYGKIRQSVITIRTNLSDYLKFIRPRLNNKSFENYKSKLRVFTAFLDNKNLSHLNIKNLDRNLIIDFSNYLAVNQELSRLTIDKYLQIVKDYFSFELDRKNIEMNPVYKIPKVGKIVDCAAVPFAKDERSLLKAAIINKDPQLWLACQIQYYCAIRPGTELRLMKINWIDFDNKQFRITNQEAKNSETEIVEIPDFLFKEIEDFNLKMYNKEYYVFGKFGIPGEIPLGKNTMRNRFNRYRDQLNISHNRVFYSWKHTGAIQLINNGARPYDVKDHLRHKNFDTTERYLRKRIKTPGKRITDFSEEI